MKSHARPSKVSDPICKERRGFGSVRFIAEWKRVVIGVKVELSNCTTSRATCVLVSTCVLDSATCEMAPAVLGYITFISCID